MLLLSSTQAYLAFLHYNLYSTIAELAAGALRVLAANSFYTRKRLILETDYNLL